MGSPMGPRSNEPLALPPVRFSLTSASMSTETPAPSALPADGPPRFHLLAKPSGSTCNIDCKYCFFLSKEALYPNDKHRMSEATLDAYIRQLLEAHRTSEVTVA